MQHFNDLYDEVYNAYLYCLNFKKWVYHYPTYSNDILGTYEHPCFNVLRQNTTTTTTRTPTHTTISTPTPTPPKGNVQKLYICTGASGLGAVIPRLGKRLLIFSFTLNIDAIVGYGVVMPLYEIYLDNTSNTV